MMMLLLKQLKKRRLALGLKQKDMLLRIGVSRQQYHHIESKGNPSLSTLELIAKGLKSELMLIPIEKLDLVNRILESETLSSSLALENNIFKQDNGNVHSDNPWKDILEDNE